MTTPELVATANCSRQARELAKPEAAPPEFLNTLEERELYYDAILFLAHTMESKPAIEWACKAIHELQPEGQPIAGQECLTASEAWLKAPADPLRFAARDIAEKSGLEAPADCVAMAVYLSGGSVTPPNTPEVDPPPYGAQRLCSGAVLMAAVLNQPENVVERQRKALALGRQIAKLPPGPPPPAREEPQQ